DGTLIVRSPVDPASSMRTAEVTGQLGNWAGDCGIVVGPDSGFYFLDGSRRSPDAAWFDATRWHDAKRPGIRFPVFAPDFVIEVRSPDDRLCLLQEKMQEYTSNGVRLGWLIDPQERTVAVYRPGREPEVLSHPTSVSGEGPVAGFVLNLERVFAA